MKNTLQNKRLQILFLRMLFNNHTRKSWEKSWSFLWIASKFLLLHFIILCSGKFYQSYSYSIYNIIFHSLSFLFMPLFSFYLSLSLFMSSSLSLRLFFCVFTRCTSQDFKRPARWLYHHRNIMSKSIHIRCMKAAWRSPYANSSMTILAHIAA